MVHRAMFTARLCPGGHAVLVARRVPPAHLHLLSCSHWENYDVSNWNWSHCLCFSFTISPCSGSKNIWVAATGRDREKSKHWNPGPTHCHTSQILLIENCINYSVALCLGRMLVPKSLGSLLVLLISFKLISSRGTRDIMNVNSCSKVQCFAFFKIFDYLYNPIKKQREIHHCT